MGINNSLLVYRPLWAGVGVVSSMVHSRGTIGCFATDASGSVWLVTARHVITSAQGWPVAGVKIYQPDNLSGALPINEPESWRLDSTGEVIAGKLDARIEVVPSWPGFEACSGVGVPKDGGAVTKVGVATGLTSGVISDIAEKTFDVTGVRGLPSDYQAFSDGDSGAGWITPIDMMLIGIHIGERVNARAVVVRADTALGEMGLTACTR
jgi:hypothetical protein